MHFVLRSAILHLIVCSQNSILVFFSQLVKNSNNKPHECQMKSNIYTGTRHQAQWQNKIKHTKSSECSMFNSVRFSYVSLGWLVVWFTHFIVKPEHELIFIPIRHTYIECTYTHTYKRNLDWVLSMFFCWLHFGFGQSIEWIPEQSQSYRWKKIFNIISNVVKHFHSLSKSCMDAC